MSAGKNQHIAFYGSHATQYPISAGSYLRRQLATGTAIAEELPVRRFGMDFRAAAALVFAVIPFDEIRIRFGDSAKASNIARARGALQWAREDFDECQGAQAFPQLPGFLFARRGQWEV